MKTNEDLVRVEPALACKGINERLSCGKIITKKCSVFSQT